MGAGEEVDDRRASGAGWDYNPGSEASPSGSSRAGPGGWPTSTVRIVQKHPMQPNDQNAASQTSGNPLSPELEAEINAAMEDMAKFAPPSAPASRPVAARGSGIRGPRVVQAGREHRSGRVVSIGPSDIFIEFGPKELGVVSRIGWPEDQLPKVADTVEVVVDRFEASESLFICSRPGSVQKADWELLEAGQTIEARVTGVNKGGLELEVAGHRAFMPASQVSADRVADMSVFVGEKMTCQVVRVERMGKGNIVLSRRDLLEQERKAKAEKLRATLVEGAVMDGVVRKIMPFGAFVDLGGLDGLVHISDMTYDRAGFGEKSVAKYVKEGQAVRVQVLKIDPEGNKISLGMKQVAGDPFATAANDIKEGSDVTGRVVRITEFGAFVELAPGVDGMVHISELDYKRVGKVEDVLKVDQVINARVLRIDAGSRRISLSIKATKPAPEPVGGEGGGPGGPGGGPGGRGKKRNEPVGRSADEILKETPALRRMREKFKKAQFKGGLS